MRSNKKKFDVDTHYATKSIKELETLLCQALDFVNKHPQFEHTHHNEYIHLLKLKIAERIGRKNTRILGRQ